MYDLVVLYPRRLAARIRLRTRSATRVAGRRRQDPIIDRRPRGRVDALLLSRPASHRCGGAPAEAIEVLRRQPCQLVIQDMNFSRRTSGEEGLALLLRIKALTPALPVVLITAWGSINLAVEGMKAGAADFVTKPWTNQQMLETVKTTLGLAAAGAAADEHAASRDDLDSRFDFGSLVGRDARCSGAAADRPRRRDPGSVLITARAAPARS